MIFMTKDKSHFFVSVNVPDGWECTKCKCQWHDKRAFAPCQNETEPTSGIDWFSINARAG